MSAKGLMLLSMLPTSRVHKWLSRMWQWKK